MASVKYLLPLFALLSLAAAAIKRRPLVFVLCLKGFRWDLPHSYPNLPHFRQLTNTGSQALWMETEFGGSQTNILSLMSGLHVEDHARREFIETIPVVNEHVGGHTRLLHWPWFDRNRNHSAYEHLRSGKKGQPEIVEPYVKKGRMSLQRLTRSITPMFNSLINASDRTNLIMSYIDEPFLTLTQHGIYSDSTRRTMLNLDRLVGRLLSLSRKNSIDLIILGDHGVEQIGCRQAIHLDAVLNAQQLNEYTERYSGTSFSFVLYPKTAHARRYLLSQLKKLSGEQIQVYSNDHAHLPPKLRLPSINGQPAPIILFPRAKFYFNYSKDRTSVFCSDRRKTNCKQSGIADYSDDPRHLSMRTALYAHGPSFKKGHINEPVLITDVYALLRQVLCLSPLSPSKGGLFHIHNMLDLTTVSNTCAHLYVSSLNMIKSVATKPVFHRKTSSTQDLKLVYVNITEKHSAPSRDLIQMRVQIN